MSSDAMDCQISVERRSTSPGRYAELDFGKQDRPIGRGNLSIHPRAQLLISQNVEAQLVCECSAHIDLPENPKDGLKTVISITAEFLLLDAGEITIGNSSVGINLEVDDNGDASQVFRSIHLFNHVDVSQIKYARFLSITLPL